MESGALDPNDLESILELTRGCWEEARGQSFFVTGGTGFIGSWLLESFFHINDRLQLDAKVAVLSRNPEAFFAKAPHLVARSDLQLVRGDVVDFGFPQGRFAYVVHAAASTAVAETDEKRLGILDEVLAGTERVLDFSRQTGVRKLLFTSSGAVYGTQPLGMARIPEDYVGAPDSTAIGSTYGLAKRLAEHLCVLRSRRDGFEVKIARCFAFVGPHLPLDGRYAVGNFIRDGLAGKTISVGGDGTPFRSYLYASDMAAWLWTILFRGGAGRPYNVGSRREISIAALAETVRSTLGSALPVSIAQLPDPHRSPSRYVPDTTRAETDLGLLESIPITEGIARTARWYRANSPTMSSP